jgi:hypothetical protein
MAIQYSNAIWGKCQTVSQVHNCTKAKKNPTKSEEENDKRIPDAIL